MFKSRTSIRTCKTNLGKFAKISVPLPHPLLSKEPPLREAHWFLASYNTCPPPQKTMHTLLNNLSIPVFLHMHGSPCKNDLTSGVRGLLLCHISNSRRQQRAVRFHHSVQFAHRKKTQNRRCGTTAENDCGFILFF